MTDVALVGTRLQELEAVFDRGIKSFVESGLALREIRESRLYREQYGTFAEYCLQRWSFSPSRGYQLIRAAEKAVCTDVHIESEAEARRLIRAGQGNGHVTTERQRQLAGAAKERIEKAVGACNALMRGADILKVEVAIPVASDQELDDWDAAFRDGISALQKLRRRVKKARDAKA